MDEALAAFRVTEANQKILHPLESELRAGFDLVAEGVEVLNGIGITQVGFIR